jgi:SAM-dependent methyltransferase
MVSKEFDPSLFHPYYFIRKGLLRNIRNYSHHLKGRLLDFGCGSKPYKGLFDVEQYIGLDYENEGHPHLNEQIDVFYDGKHVPFEDNSFDSILCSEVFEHISNLEEVIKELSRVLKPGGKILITCPFVWPEHEKPFDFARYTQYSLKKDLEKQGFGIIVIDKSGDFFTAFYQMMVAYTNDILLPKLSFGNRVPIITSIARKIFIPSMNAFGKALSFLLPKSKDLYLNNVVIAEKIAQ